MRNIDDLNFEFLVDELINAFNRQCVDTDCGFWAPSITNHWISTKLERYIDCDLARCKKVIDVVKHLMSQNTKLAGFIKEF